MRNRKKSLGDSKKFHKCRSPNLLIAATVVLWAQLAQLNAAGAGAFDVKNVLGRRYDFVKKLKFHKLVFTAFSPHQY